MSKSTALPIPYLGLNDKVPIAGLEYPYCEICDNFKLDNGKLEARLGDTRFATGAANQPVLALDSLGAINPTLIVVTDTGGQLTWRNITSGGAGTVVWTPAGLAGDDEIHTVYFNGHLFYCGEFTLAANPFDYSTGAVSGYTNTSGAFGGAVHKNRAYFIKRYSSIYKYSGIDAVAGALTDVDLSGIITNQSFLYGIRSISLSEGINQENVAAFIFEDGEVLVYGGSYPDSPSWGIVARFIIPKPIYYNSFVDARGDSYVMTEAGPISLRTLFLQGPEVAIQQGIGSLVKNRWQQIVKANQAVGFSSSYFMKGVYDQTNDRLIFSFPYYVVRETDATESWSCFMVYSFKANAWYEHYAKVGGYYSTRICYSKDSIYYGNANGPVMKFEGATQIIDQEFDGDEVGVALRLRTAPNPTKKYGTVKVDGVEVIMSSDCYDLINFKLVGDFGAIESENQQTSGNGTNITNCMVNVGLESTYTQLELNATTDTNSDDVTIYSTNLWTNSGQQGSR